MATTHSSTRRTKGNDHPIKVDWGKVWEEVEKDHSQDEAEELLRNGYLTTMEISKRLNISSKHIDDFCLSRNWDKKKARLQTGNGNRMVNFYRPPIINKGATKT